jgi:hypothetical protein
MRDRFRRMAIVGLLMLALAAGTVAAQDEPVLRLSLPSACRALDASHRLPRPEPGSRRRWRWWMHDRPPSARS